MRVVKIEIKNFRGIREGSICFGEHPVLIGSNNSGKSTIIEALTLILGRDGMIRDLSEHDFYGSSPRPQDRMQLIATIAGFPGNDPDLSGDWFRDGRAVPKWYDAVGGQVHPLPHESQLQLCCQIGLQAYFDCETLAVEVFRYFHDYQNPIDPFVGDSPVAVPTSLIRQLGYFLIRTNRTWEKVMSWGSELFRRTIKVTAAQPATALIEERDRLRDPQQPIEEDSNISPLIDRVNAEISHCMPGEPSLKLRITHTDSRSLMDSVIPHFTMDGGPCLPAGRHGSGLVSLQGLLLLLELGRVREESEVGFIMALEEPELHLPPATQQKLVQRVQSLSTQTFVTTHSPLVAAMADPTSVLMVSKEEGQLSVQPFLESPLSADTQNWKRRFFQQSRVEVIAALMQPSLLIPEGKTEYYLFKMLLRPLMLTEGWSPLLARDFTIEVGVVPTEDAKVVETHALLSRIHKRVCCLVDGDADGKRYANTLAGVESPPSAIVSWHEGATLEDAVGWILAADTEYVVSAINQNIEDDFDDISAVVRYLKKNKMDMVFHEHLADIIANNAICSKRAATLFSGLASACAGLATPEFLQDENGVWVFQP